MLGIMKKQLILFFALSLCLSPLSAKVYKWVDEEGNIQYGDRPVEGAETVKVPKSNSFTPPPLPEEEEPGAGTGATDGSYTTFSIAEPENNATIRSNEGKVAISFFIEPTLQEGDAIVLYIDGQKMKGKNTSTRLSITNLERGTHTLRADILSAEGVKRASTKPVVFQLRKEAIAEQGQGQEQNGEKPYKPGAKPDYKAGAQPSYKKNFSHNYKPN